MTWSTPSTVGIRDYGQVVGLFHSHTAAVFDASKPVRSQYPTPNAAAVNQQGDWYGFDYYRGEVEAALSTTTYQMSPADRMARVALFRQYVLGLAGPAGSNAYKLHGFDTNDRDADTGDADDLGQEIDMGLALCP